MIKDDQIGWTRHHHHFAYTALIQQQPHLNPTPYLKPGHSVQVYSNQKEIASNISKTHPPQLHFTSLLTPKIREILWYTYMFYF